MSSETKRTAGRSSLPDAHPVIEFRHASYQLPDGRALLRDLNLAVERGETLVLLGRSGAGKSTALKLINRMLEPSDGAVMVEGRSTLEGDPIELRRRIGYVSQEVGLFPHFTVEQNISLLPRLEHWPEDRIRARVAELLQLVGLSEAEFFTGIRTNSPEASGSVWEWRGRWRRI